MASSAIGLIAGLILPVIYEGTGGSYAVAVFCGSFVGKALKHTVNVLPGSKVSFDLTADALGDWAFHCHMMLHMHAGMFRVVTVRHDEDAA